MSIYQLRIRKRIVFTFSVFVLFFILVAIRLTSIQAIDSINLSDEQISQMMGEVPLTAARGNIYDRNMNILTKDASASAIYARPKDIEKRDDVVTYLSEVLDIDKDALHKKISDTSNWIILIKRKVDNEVAIKIRDKKFKGIEISEDKKRYYTNDNFASYILGFTGTDHKGLYGIESVFNNNLSGIDGVLVYQKDGKNQKVASGYQMRIEPRAGDNIRLTIDSIVQHFLETQTEKAFRQLGAKRVIAIAMDPKTGDIFGMSSKPDYNLNNPRTIPKIFDEKFTNEFTDSSGKMLSLGEKQLFIWQNPAVSYNYEPGSTFKAITASAVLEEGVVTAQTPFFDKGYIDINGIRIKAHNYPNSYGLGNFAKGVQNSSNPVLVEAIQRLEPDDFYKYIYNFGFGDQTGIELDGEQYGIVPPYDGNLLNYVTKSYGQGIAVTPIQLITALSAIVNDGKYMRPNIAKQILSNVNNEIIKEYNPEQVRQVISVDTADMVKDIMNKVVSESDHLSKLSEYHIGGKTGTAQKIISGRYAKGKYITSFFGFAPVNDPKITILFIVDEPSGSNSTGSNTAAPAAIEFINNTLNYMDVPNSKNKDNFRDNGIAPELRNQEISFVREQLNRLNIQYKIIGNQQNGMIVNQEPMPGSLITKDTIINLTVDNETLNKGDIVTVPNVMDMTIQRVNETLNRSGLHLTMKGIGGVSIKQTPPAGKQVKYGSTVTVEFKHIK